MRRTILSVLLFLFGIEGTSFAMPHKNYGGCEGNCEQQLEVASLNCLAQTIFYEAGNQPTRGKVAVAFVVLNRAKRNQKTICEIVKQRGQFFWVGNKELQQRPKNKKQWEACLELAKDILINSNEYEDPTNGALAFRRVNDHPFQKGWIALATIGPHIFYSIP